MHTTAAVRNGVHHGKTDATIVLEAAVGDDGTTIFTVAAAR